MMKFEICRETPAIYDRDRRERFLSTDIVSVPSAEFISARVTESGFLTVHVYGEDLAPTHVFGRVLSVRRIG
jgi:hypothetical protein